MLNEIKEILKNVMPDTDLSGISPESSLTADVGIDSVKMMMLAIEIEDHFNIQFQDDVPMETVQDLMNYIEEQTR